MNLPLNVARKYSKLPKDTQEILDIISLKIGEVESYTDYSILYKGIVVGEIKEAKDHPDADKLGVYMVDIGKGDLIQVVAGDKTLKVSDKIAYINPGNIVPSTARTSEPFEIKAVKMRGVLSNGMLCSEKELDIGPDHAKVLVLPNDAPLGEEFSKYFEFDDTVVNIENKALTNRGDLFGILGLAREISAAQGIKFESPLWYKEDSRKLHSEEGNEIFDVDNQAKTLCPRYCAIALDNVEVKESPIWLKSILLKSDIRPINNVVDITNYLMILTGQPLHAFDLDKVLKNDNKKATKAHIIVRLATDGEKIHALDGNVYTLNSKNLVIANSQYPIAIAGIIGGEDTQIDSNTKRIILESANFDKYSLRKTSMELGINTDSSTRFTRSQDEKKCDNIASYAVTLLEEITNASILTELIDSYPVNKKENIKTVDLEKLNNRLGLDITQKEVTSILENLEYELRESKGKHLSFLVPSFRNDIEIEEDIYEDIVRIYGYENIEHKLPLRPMHAVSRDNIVELKSNIRNILSYSGCNELVTYNFIGKRFLESINQDPNMCFHITNPQANNLDFMRPSILSTLLDKTALNTQEGIESFAIYEIGMGHLKDSLDSEELPLEEWKLGFVFSDSANTVEGNPYFQSKRYLEKVLNTLKISKYEYTLLSDFNNEQLPDWLRVISNSFELNSSAIVWAQIGQTKVYIGIVGEINNMVKKNLKLNSFTSGFEININAITQLMNSKKLDYKEFRYPAITQDICFVCPEQTKYIDLEQDVLDSIKFRDGEVVVNCIDIYQKDEDKKRITLRISVRHLGRTLDLKEFKKYREKISKRVSNRDIEIL